MTQHVVEVERLGKRLGNRQVIRDVSMHVARGDVYGFLGPNGAGKTTTLRLLVGLIAPDNGTVVIDGRDLRADRMAAIAGIGALVETPRFHGSLTARDNLRLGARLMAEPGRGNRPDALGVERALDLVGLRERAGDPVRTYSLGMKQRLGIANALLGEPSVVVLDEPTNGLDPQGMAEMRNLIRRLAETRGTTFLISSHLLHEVETLCNRVGIIAHGSMVAEGSVEELCVRSERCEVETTDVDLATAVIASCGIGSVLDRQDSRLVVELHGVSSADLNARLVAGGVAVRYLVPSNAALESVFMEITKGATNVA